ncbi:AAA family ATPase [Bacteroides sp. OM05-12]|jgi:wobble nucleotide-excising tRNase|uniref:AAA family ATPase n=1 Tax=Bacteroides sp. OM05-12 TaxID=2292283 RepID=UPI000E834CFD|nr:AAA family ATPase [Bacteroides sp. OM05-12]RGN42844.1 anticodon nuclease [Bacteroides sp. OM05-12]
MGQTLTEIAETLRGANKKVQLIYAFNGTGKTRLSREFKELIAPKDDEEDDAEDSGIKILYYNAFTEDLFYWDNDLDADSNRKLKIQPNGFTDWVLRDQGQEFNIATHLQHYTSDKLTPRFNEEYTIKDKEGKDVTIKAYSEITFSIESGNEGGVENIKISKGEESCLIWCVFYSLLEQVVEVLNIAEPAERETNQFNDLEYVFIDDPVSSLDDNHLIELAVNIAELIKSSKSDLKFIITTHNPLFYNVLFNEFKGVKRILKSRFDKLEDGTYLLEETKDSPFSYHLLLLSELEKAIESNDMQKYHFNFLRNILEKTSTFLGYESWRELLPEESREAYCNRIINLYSHSKHSGEEIAIVREDDKRMLSFLVREIKRVYGFK